MSFSWLLFTMRCCRLIRFRRVFFSRLGSRLLSRCRERRFSRFRKEKGWMWLMVFLDSVRFISFVMLAKFWRSMWMMKLFFRRSFIVFRLMLGGTKSSFLEGYRVFSDLDRFW